MDGAVFTLLITDYLKSYNLEYDSEKIELTQERDKLFITKFDYFIPLPVLDDFVIPDDIDKILVQEQKKKFVERLMANELFPLIAHLMQKLNIYLNDDFINDAYNI